MEPPPELREALARLQALSATVAELERQIAEARPAGTSWRSEQARLRENLAAVPPESDLARRYLGGLAASEDELAALATRLAGLRAELERAAQARAAFVRSLRL